MKTAYIYIFTLISLCLFSCSEEPSTKQISLDSHKNISGVPITNSEHLDLSHMLVSDSFMIIADMSIDSNMLYAYRTQPFSLIGKFLRVGKGPSELLKNFMFNKQIVASDGMQLSITDLNSNLISEFDLKLSSFGTKSTVYWDTCYRIPRPIFPSFNISISDDYYVGNGIVSSKNGLFFVYDRKNKRKKWIENFPIVKPEPENDYLYSNVVFFNPEKSIIVCGMKYFNLIHFFKPDGTLIKSTSVGESITPQLGDKLFSISDDSKVYTKDIYGTEEYIYILRYEKSTNDQEINYNNTSSLYIFNWQGDYVKSYTIPYSYRVAVNPSNTTMYTFSVTENGNPELRRYDINN